MYQYITESRVGREAHSRLSQAGVAAPAHHYFYDPNSVLGTKAIKMTKTLPALKKVSFW